jgi:hypothetical protein
MKVTFWIIIFLKRVGFIFAAPIAVSATNPMAVGQPSFPSRKWTSRCSMVSSWTCSALRS